MAYEHDEQSCNPPDRFFGPSRSTGETASISRDTASKLLRILLDILSRDLPSWQERIEALGQMRALCSRKAGEQLNDEAAYQCIFKAILTATGAPWGPMERQLPALAAMVHGYDLSFCASRSEQEIADLALWLASRGANGPWLRLRLRDAFQCAKIVVAWAREYGSVEGYLNARLVTNGREATGLAKELATPGLRKLPGMQLPIAAEALKNLGFDLVKPDRHISRAAACLGLVHFRHWDSTKAYSAPKATQRELLDVVRIFAEIADLAGEQAVLIDNVIWLLCSAADSGGLHMTNADLRDVGAKCGLR